MAEEIYDVVIVGSGIAGSIMAKTLTQAGKNVLLLEAGLKSGYTKNKQAFFKNYLEYVDTFHTASAKVPNSPYPHLTNAKMIDLLIDEKLEKDQSKEEREAAYLVQRGRVAFGSDNTRIAGGTTLHWLGSTPRMLPNDFCMKDLYDVGVNWPISYEDLVPYYEMAELEMGVSGTAEGQTIPGADSNHYGADYQFPMKKIPESYSDQVLMEKIEQVGDAITMDGKTYQLHLASTPQGRNSDPNPDYAHLDVIWVPGEGTEPGHLELTNQVEWNPSSGRYVRANPPESKYHPLGANWNHNVGSRCEGNASCVPICPVQAKYHALRSLQKTNARKMTMISQAVASKVIVNEDNTVDGILYKQYVRDFKPGDKKAFFERRIAKGKIYVLAASAIENAKILLSSDPVTYANGEEGVPGNSSDQVGRNLMDHITKLGWGLLEDGRLYPFRGPGSTTNVATFRDGEFRKDHAACILPFDNWGWGWPAISPGSDVVNAVDNEGLYGQELRDALHDRITRQFLIHFECEQLPDPNNRVEIDPSIKDTLGNPRPVIYYDIDDYSKKALDSFDKVQQELFEKLGIEDHSPATLEERNKYYGTGHIVGTHRMGDDSTVSVVNENCRTWDHENLFLIGCGSMPTIGTSNPTLTMTALTFKAAEAILNQLEGK